MCHFLVLLALLTLLLGCKLFHLVGLVPLLYGFSQCLGVISCVLHFTLELSALLPVFFLFAASSLLDVEGTLSILGVARAPSGLSITIT